jgi:hypothetical protein
MKSQSKVKFYWVQDDFKYIGRFSPKEGNTVHAVAHIDSFVADDNMVRIVTRPIQFFLGQEEVGHSINLLRE